MRLFFLLLSLILLFIFFAGQPTKPLEEDLILENGCLIYSLQFKKALRAGEILNDSDVWNKIIFLKIRGDKAGHAVVLFIHNNITYAFDPGKGSFTLAYFPVYDPWDVAELLYPYSEILMARYAETAMIYQMSGLPDY